MSYISSDKIEIFPYSRVRTINGNNVNNDRLLYETRVANIIRQCLGMKSGITGIILSDVIDASVNANTITFNTDFEFNIWGYYIKIDSEATLTFDTLSNYIVCNIELTGDDVTEHINGSDEDNVFKAISISTSATASDEVDNTSISFTLASIDNGAIEVYTPNTYRVPESELRIISIDGNSKL